MGEKTEKSATLQLFNISKRSKIENLATLQVCNISMPENSAKFAALQLFNISTRARVRARETPNYVQWPIYVRREYTRGGQLVCSAHGAPSVPRKLFVRRIARQGCA